MKRIVFALSVFLLSNTFSLLHAQVEKKEINVAVSPASPVGVATLHPSNTRIVQFKTMRDFNFNPNSDPSQWNPTNMDDQKTKRYTFKPESGKILVSVKDSMENFLFTAATNSADEFTVVSSAPVINKNPSSALVICTGEFQLTVWKNGKEVGNDAPKRSIDPVWQSYLMGGQVCYVVILNYETPPEGKDEVLNPAIFHYAINLIRNLNPLENKILVYVYAPNIKEKYNNASDIYYLKEERYKRPFSQIGRKNILFARCTTLYPPIGQNAGNKKVAGLFSFGHGRIFFSERNRRFLFSVLEHITDGEALQTVPNGCVINDNQKEISNLLDTFKNNLIPTGFMMALNHCNSGRGFENKKRKSLLRSIPNTLAGKTTGMAWGYSGEIAFSQKEGIMICHDDKTEKRVEAIIE